MERNKDLSDALLKKINRDMKRAHREIKRKNSLLRKSLALANEIQLNLLPQHDPVDEYLDVTGRSIYCSATGGDYYDYIRFPKIAGHRLDVVVGDVTGHGIEAALLMTTARAFLRARTFQPGSLAQVVTDVNRHLTADLYETGRFMTLFYLTIDPAADRLGWVRAGHDPAIIFDPGNRAFPRAARRRDSVGRRPELALRRTPKVQPGRWADYFYRHGRHLGNTQSPGRHVR